MSGRRRSSGELDLREEVTDYYVVDNYIMLLVHFTRQNCVDAADIRSYLGVDEEYEDISP